MSKKRPSPDSVLCIDLTEDSDDEQNQRLGDVRRSLNPADTTLTSKRAKIKQERRQKAIAETAKLALHVDGIEVVDAAVAAPPIVPVARVPAADTSATKTDDDIEIIGAKNELRLPHLRQDCTQFKFDPASQHGYPYRTYSRSTVDSNSKTCDLCYCYVCDCPAKDCKTWCSEVSTTCGANHCCANNTVPFWTRERKTFKATGKASLPTAAPATAQRTNISTSSALRHDDFALIQRHKCRKCGYEQSHFFSQQIRHLPNEADFCSHCGRVALANDLGKQQRKEFKKEGKVLFGTRKIKFRMKARDPRKDPKYSPTWRRADTSLPEWQYSKADMKEDVFHHRIGSRPRSLRHMVEILALKDKASALSRRSDHILVESEQDVDLLSLLYRIGAESSCNIEASWDKTAQNGALKIDYYFSNSMFQNSSNWSNDSWTHFLGLWYGIFPLKLSDVMTPHASPDLSWMTGNINFLNSLSSRGLSDDAINKMKSDLSSVGAGYKTARDDEQGKLLTLLCSSGKPSEGHFCTDDLSFSGLFRRFYSEILKYRKYDGQMQTATKLALFEEGKIYHKDRGDQVLGTTASVFHGLSTNQNPSRNCSIRAVMTRLENIGHEAGEFVEGLNVELLGFQRQTLKWALERETMEGGIQRLLWGKLPDDPTRQDKEVYYNPILGGFRREAPKLVRGGFIAEEMGLGKTVISLALILKNPAPAVPISGSSVLDLEKETAPASWDKNLYKSTSTTNNKRGSILSRGTLVICPVSLVGQWIEEAKSKLEDPGLVYPYHGQNRKRNAHILCKNSIVVTTYQVLASDATYHAARGGEDYCPPLEQVRWWRVICDEGHSLRGGGTSRSHAVLSLVADHKWLVSGTPMNTSMNDLANQFKFLGIEYADELIRSVDGRGGRNPVDPNPELIQFLLGGIMMRHSQKQKYRGTETTLMSLPKKTERTITIPFAGTEKTEYEKIEKTAHDFYVGFRKKEGHAITKHYLKLTQKLMPLRVACAGGKYPLPESVGEKCEDNDKKMKPVKFSNFAFTSKLRVLLKELERIRDSDPSSKSLVFSQFGSTLEWLQQELPKHGFQYRTLKGDMTMSQRAKALHDFQSDPPTTIFLLSMRAGAVGINLTQANRVFLMEPCFNPALENQAIGRVHRLGQKREVDIVRLIHKDSVESRMLKFLEKKYGKSSEKETKGTATGNNNDNDDKDHDSSDKKVAAAPVDVGLVGNVSRDKVQIMTEEFDLLFGAEGIVFDSSVEDGEQGPESPAVADKVSSFMDGYV